MCLKSVKGSERCVSVGNGRGVERGAAFEHGRGNLQRESEQSFKARGQTGANINVLPFTRGYQGLRKQGYLCH